MVHAFRVKFGRQGRLDGLVLSPNVMHPMPGAILCHGLGSGQGAVSSSGLSLAKHGIAALVFDFRGHGRSGGIFDGNEVEDVVDAWQWLSQYDGVDKGRIALIGHSMGARAAILAACKVDSPGAVVALACPSDPDEKLNQDKTFDLGRWTKKGNAVMEYPMDGTLPWLGGAHAVGAWFWMYLRGYRLRIDWKRYFTAFSNVKVSTALQGLGGCPKLLVHHQGDKRTPYQAVVEFYRKAPEPKDLLLAKGGFHAASLMPGNLRKRWISWVVNVLTSETSEEVGFYG